MADENTVKYFMWGFQNMFQISAEVTAKQVFDLLDNRLAPHIFLVGLRTKERSYSLPVCVEPDDCAYQPEQFGELEKAARTLYEAPQSGFYLHPNQWVADQFDARRFRSCVAQAIYDAVEQNTDTTRLVTFCSAAIRVENYLVCVVMHLNRDVQDAWPALQKTVVDRCGVERSLIQATASAFLSYCADELQKPDAGRYFLRTRGVEEIVRAAGKDFMYTASNAGGNFAGLHTLYEACNVISSLRYEGAEGIGQLSVSRIDHPSLFSKLKLVSPVPLTDYRAARKMLELASGDLFLFSDSWQVFALGEISPEYDATQENLFVVRFVKHHTWELWHGNFQLMHVAYGNPRLPRVRFGIDKFVAMMRRVFPQIADDDLEYLTILASSSSELGHGTMLVISGEADTEAKRLKDQCVGIEPMRMTPDVLRRVTGIDGAVLLDTQARCHAIGVILDGMASPKGTASRGARYNSAIRYVYSRASCLAVVVSEDGMIDVIPDLRPRIARQDLHSALDALRVVANQNEVAQKDLGKVMDTLSGYQFYLSGDECAEVNRLVVQAKERYTERDGEVVYDPLEPSDDMSDSYFLDE